VAIRALMVLTCTGVSFFHGSNDGQKGMGLIMLILIGTVPTAYALNHAVSPAEVQSFIAASEQAGQILDRHVSQGTAADPDPRGEVTRYIQTRELQPNTLAAMSQLVNELNREVEGYKSFQAVPARDQANVRNDMYLTAAALKQMEKGARSGVHQRGELGAEELPRQAGQEHEVHSRLGEGGRGTGARAGNHGGLETHCGER